MAPFVIHNNKDYNVIWIWNFIDTLTTVGAERDVLTEWHDGSWACEIESFIIRSNAVVLNFQIFNDVLCKLMSRKL